MRPGLHRGESRRSGCRGFTLVEILLVLALISLVASLFVASASDLFRSQEKTMNDVFWQSIQAARLQAVTGDRTIEMRYDEKKNQLVWGEGETLVNQPWPGKKLEFLPAEKGDTMLLGGQLVGTGAMPLVRFYADGCVENFKAQMTSKGGIISTLEIDPWTCAQVVRAVR